MIARHKRLALLDAASSDREVPVPRRELLRQVASWEVSGRVLGGKGREPQREE